MLFDFKQLVIYFREENEDDMHPYSREQVEDIRKSNFKYSQTKVAEYLNFYFALIGVGSSIVASEINRYYNYDDSNKDHIIA